jgi:hypothetical protein
MELDARVEIFGVLAEDHQIEAVLEVEGVPLVTAAGAEADVEVEHLPHPDDRRAVDQSLAAQMRIELLLGRLHRLRGDRAEHRRVHAAEKLDRPLREGVPFAAPELPADVSMNVLGVELDPIEDDLRRFQNFLPDAVSGKPCDLVTSH